MPDMLVRLYELPDAAPCIRKLEEEGFEIRRPIGPEKHVIVDWVKETFGSGWASECEVAFSNKPVSCFIAVKDKKVIGFACFDATCRNFFGPTGVSNDMRGKGIGKALLLACMFQMRSDGYAYAIIGGAGPKDFYKKILNAVVIEDSVPGIYKGMLV